MMNAIDGTTDGRRGGERKIFYLVDNIKIEGRYDLTKKCDEDQKR